MTTSHLRRRPALRNALACVAAIAATAGCAAAAATPAPSAGRAPDGTAGVACLRALTVAGDIRLTITKADAKGLSWSRASTALDKDAASLRRIAGATTDDAAPEAIQDVADAVTAFADAATATDLGRAADLRVQALDGVKALQVVCPVADGGFESGATGWGVSGAVVSRTSAAHSGSWAALVTASQGSTSATLTVPARVITHNRTRYDIGVWARSDRPLTLVLQVTEHRGGTAVGSALQTVTLGTGWQQVAVAYRALSPGSSLSVQLLLARLPAGASVTLDDLWILHH